MGNKVYLRALEPDDYKISIQWRNDDKIWAMLGGPKYFVSSDYEKQWISNTSKNGDYKLAICTIENDEFIGIVYLTNIDYINRKAHSHILIGNHNYWGQGYATEAMQLIIKFAFDERNLHRIEAYVLENNIGSCKLHEKLGYVKEGILRDSVYKNGKYHNQIVYSLINNK